ncbi:DNA methylase N-4 [Sphingobium indicum]|uniref:Methyltransferase n=1 Tax=Sphingobium indicum TaxID=332055 RepID=A0A4Q4ISQ1_9SPHN|nr:DNA modification methylase [Sphingobium indicum]NYI25005.1 DNA modification methylase [Sphingobium indicum]RYL96493.1 DNA methylase N-4 [Sphingobium indicum]
MSLGSGELNEIPGLGDNLSAAVEIRVNDLQALPGHPWKISKADIDRAKPIVARYGDRVLPVLVDDENRVISGEIFVEAARLQRRKTIRVIRQSGLSSADSLMMGMAITKLQTLGNWDNAAMEAALREFEKSIEDFSASLIGFAPGELDRIIGAASVGAEADRIPAMQPLAVSQPGTIWKCGNHLLLCGDATDSQAILALLDGETVSVALCDPPFGCRIDGFVSKRGRHREFVQASGEMDGDALLDFFSKFCRAMATVLAPGALVYLFIDWRSLRLLQQAAEAVFGKLINLCVWAKDRAGMGSFYRSQHELILLFAMPGARHRNNVELGRHGRDRSNLWSWPCAASSRKGREGDMLANHPTPKPVEMIAEAIIDSSLRTEIVFDCFLGSGTTLIAAERTGRRFRGMDLDPLYVDLAVRRWQQWTGMEAVDAASGRSFNEIAQEVGNAKED